MKKFLISILLIGVAAILLLGTLRGIPGNPDSSQFKNNLDQATKPFELSPERGRYSHIFSLAEDGHYDLSKEWAEAVYPDVGYSGGKFYSFFAPGISYLALPFYELGRYFNLAQVFTFGFISFCAILTLIFLYKISKEIFSLPKSISILVSLTFLFATTSWSYAITLYQHHVFTLLIVSGFYAVWRYKQESRFSWVWGAVVWLNYGLAILIDYPNAILMLPIMVYFLLVSVKVKNVQNKLTIGIRSSILMTFIIFIGISVLHGYHNQIHFGSWKNLSGGIVGYKDIKENNILTSDNSDQQLADLSSKKNVVNFFSEDKLPFGFFTLLFSRDRGLFLFSPILLLGIIGLFMVLRKLNIEHGVMVGLILVNLMLYSSWGDPWGGWAFGPRYLIPSMAILSIYVGVFLNQIKYKFFGKLIFFVLFAYSSAIALLGALTTNAVPPKIEADYLHTGYNFLYNWKFFKANRSGSYIYNNFLSDKLSLLQYAEIILGIIALIVIVFLFIIPKFENASSNNK